MKQFKIKYPKQCKGIVSTIRTFLGDGGFIIDEAEYVGNGKQDIEFTIECNSDTEFADLMMEVGKHSALISK